MELLNRITWQMNKKTAKPETSKNLKANEKRASRKARQGEALRENLLKRKAQRRQRLEKN